MWEKMESSRRAKGQQECWQHLEPIRRVVLLICLCPFRQWYHRDQGLVRSISARHGDKRANEPPVASAFANRTCIATRNQGPEPPSVSRPISRQYYLPPRAATNVLRDGKVLASLGVGLLERDTKVVGPCMRLTSAVGVFRLALLCVLLFLFRSQQ